MHSPDELKALVEEALERLDLWPELHGQATSVRYALEVGGKRVRPVIALAVGEALGAPVEQVMPAALAIELVHTFSLVHDDLPAMDDDEERRGHPSTWKKFGEGVGVLAGDALLAEAVRLAARYESSAVARELAEATLGMIGGQYLDTMVDGYDLAAVHRLKTGRLFYASVTMALWAAELPEEEQAPWRAFAEELGLLFQIVDDILDADGYVREHGAEARARLRRRRRRTGAGAARRGRRRHVRPARHRRRSRRPHGLSTAGWYPVEREHAGPEHLEADYVAGYDAKTGLDLEDALGLLRRQGLGADTTLLDLAAAPACSPQRPRPRPVVSSVSTRRRPCSRSPAVGATQSTWVEAGFLSYEHEGDPPQLVHSRNALHHLPDFWKGVALSRIHGSAGAGRRPRPL